ncbi:hypothetical protein NIIDMKKI_08130 [Mycobacterium kansasii]|uniref:Uncharacterized protein n=1 Tax=Mycobacterium kansasii TaxID=1768 RepID=A0A7G1I3J1_MYCKA|nr:hypothetical protein NIIDMKKI_08130 [Mycobacterium kansasii]
MVVTHDHAEFGLTEVVVHQQAQCPARPFVDFGSERFSGAGGAGEVKVGGQHRRRRSQAAENRWGSSEIGDPVFGERPPSRLGTEASRSRMLEMPAAMGAAMAV